MSTPYYIAFAFSNQPTPPAIRPDEVVAYASSDDVMQLDLNINPVVITAPSLQADAVAPPTPGVQLAFFWG